MGFPIPGDAIEQSLDLNHLVIKNTAATFFMRVDGTHITNADVQPGDILAVDRSLDAKDTSLIVVTLNGELTVMRLQQANHHLRSTAHTPNHPTPSFEIWGVVTTIIRSV